MENKFSLDAIWAYFINHGGAHYHSEASAQCVEKRPYAIEFKMEANLSSEFSELIRQAARCNRYGSDLIYDINNVNDAMETWEGERKLFVFGFRRDGVDGNSFVLSRINNECKSIYDIHKLYFAIYFMEVVKYREYNMDFHKVITDGYYL